MLLSYFLYGKTLSVTEQENPEEPYVGKTVAYTILSQSAKQKSSPLGGKCPMSHIFVIIMSSILKRPTSPQSCHFQAACLMDALNLE